MKKLTLTTQITNDNLIYVQDFNRKIIKAAILSVKNLFNADEFSLIKESVDKSTSQNALHPLHMQLATGIIKPENLNNPQAREILKKSFLARSESQPVRIIDFNTSDLEELKVIDWTNSFFNSHLDEEGKTYLKKGNEVSEKAKLNLIKSFDFLEQEWPLYFDLGKNLCSHIALVSSSRFQSGVTLNTFGAIFTNIMKKLQYPEVLEIYVHEVAHLHLLAHEQSTQFVLNEDEKVESPLRYEMRPLRGTFHSCYSLVRMTEVLHKYITKYREDDFALEMFKNNRSRLNKGLTILAEKANLSEDGNILFQSMQAKLKEFDIK